MQLHEQLIQSKQTSAKSLVLARRGMTKSKSRFSLHRAWRSNTRAKLFGIEADVAVSSIKARSREKVFRILLRSTTLMFVLLLLPLFFSTFVVGNYYVLPRLIICLMVVITLLGIGVFWKKLHKYTVAAVLLILLYFTALFVGIIVWGINLPFTALLTAIVILLSGILLGARTTPYAALLCSITYLVAQIMVATRISRPQPQTLYPSQYGDVLGYSILFFILALLAWLYGTQMERSLQQALTAEEELLQERNSLAEKLEERTRSLQAAQLKEMQQLYRFAELGQLSTALLHDLSNHLTVLTLDIEDLRKRQHSRAIDRAKQTIFYLDKMVDQVKLQLQENKQITRFSVEAQLKEVVDQLHAKAVRMNVKIALSLNKKSTWLAGDPVRFKQIVTILLSNAVDAYTEAIQSDRKVLLSADVERNTIVIRCKDNGVGISKQARKQLFKPFYSTKDTGMGIGLYIARQMLETHFKGNVTISDELDYTEFIIKIPTQK